jgi:hypothetical protein
MPKIRFQTLTGSMVQWDKGLPRPPAVSLKIATNLIIATLITLFVS